MKGSDITEHGGNIRTAEMRYGHPKGSMIDLSTGIAPRPWPVPDEFFTPDGLRDLPQDEDMDALLAAARMAYGIPDGASVLAAPGSEMISGLVARLNHGNGKTVAMAEPVYGGHKEAWRKSGQEIWNYPAGDAGALADYTRWQNAVVVNPGNPLGEVMERDALLAAARHAKSCGGVLVVDEAFGDLAPEVSLAQSAGQPGLIVLKSFGKFFGMGGVRLGFAIGHGDDIARLGGLLGRWTVSNMAVKIGHAALGDRDFAASQRAYLRTQSAAMQALFAEHQLKRIGGCDLFHLLEHERAAELHDHLARAGIWTRIYKDYPRWLRLGTAAPDGVEKLGRAFASFGK